MSKVEQFVDLLRSQVDRGIYVWGGNGQAVTAMKDPEKWIRQMEQRHPDGFEENVKRDIALLNKRIAAGVSPVLAFDCSGLMYWAGKQVGVFTSDVNSRAIYGKCDKISKGDVKAGDFVFRTDSKGTVCHVGMFVGDNAAIECKGRDVGVVCLALGSSWDLYGRLPALQEAAPPEQPEKKAKRYIVVKGGSVHVRAGNGTRFLVVGTAHNAAYYKQNGISKGSDEFLCLGQAREDPYWWRIEYEGAQAYISSNTRYTEETWKAN